MVVIAQHVIGQPGGIRGQRDNGVEPVRGERPIQGLPGPLAAHQLDAIVTLTANPAWLTDYVLGDHDIFHSSGPAAVAGYPAVTVMAGNVAGLPVGLSFLGPAWSEPALIALAYAFERCSPPWPAPAMRPGHPDGDPAYQR